MQVASNPALANPAPVSPPPPPAAPSEPQAAAGAEPNGRSSLASAMLMQGGTRPLPSAWGNPEFAQSPSAGLANLGMGGGGTVSFFVDDRMPTQPRRPIFGDLPAPSYISQGAHALIAQIPPRRDGEREPSVIRTRPKASKTSPREKTRTASF